MDRPLGWLSGLSTRFAPWSIFVDDPDEVIAATRDRDDDYLIALAQAHRADFIVTGDRDLLEWADQQPRVITPAAFETLLAAAD